MTSTTTKSTGVVTETTDAELAAVLEASDDAFVLYDASGGIRLASTRLKKLLDLSEVEWDSLEDFPSFAQLLSRRLVHCHPTLRPPWLLWNPGSEVGCEYLELASGGRALERTARPIEVDSAQSSGWVERYRESHFNGDLPARLFQTDKLAALGQMVAGIAHELNNPLTSVMGYSQLLLDRPLDCRIQSDVRHICQEAERAARVVRSLLTFAREAKLDRSPVQLNEIVDRTLRLCTYDLRRANITVETDLAPQLPPALANPIHLQQVVLNLLVNSRQAIIEAGRPGRVLLRTRHGGGRVFLHVEDDGPGIPSELQSRIFEPFFTTKPVGVGTGLGLSIVTGILRQHGGEIWVSSTPGTGAAFVVSLPSVDVLADSVGYRQAPASLLISP